MSSSEVFVFEPMRDSYYLETVVFKVENTIFRVPRFQFERHSGVFATTFSLPQPAEGAEGSDDKNPITLDGIKSLDFQTLLKILYPLTAIPKTPSLNEDQWISVLKLATLWDFLEVRNLAIERLASLSESLNCIDRILFARQYDVSSWLRSGYTELARRKTTISSVEAMKIGWEVALQISQLREAALGHVNNPYEKVDLGTTFQAEFRRADSAHEPLARIRSPKTLLSIAGTTQTDTGATSPFSSAKFGQPKKTSVWTPNGPSLFGKSATDASKAASALNPVATSVDPSTGGFPQSSFPNLGLATPAASSSTVSGSGAFSAPTAAPTAAPIVFGTSTGTSATTNNVSGPSAFGGSGIFGIATKTSRPSAFGAPSAFGTTTNNASGPSAFGGSSAFGKANGSNISQPSKFSGPGAFGTNTSGSTGTSTAGPSAFGTPGSNVSTPAASAAAPTSISTSTTTATPSGASAAGPTSTVTSTTTTTPSST